jgi:hypothetical protein
VEVHQGSEISFYRAVDMFNLSICFRVKQGGVFQCNFELL